MKRIIINSDDFAYTKSCSRGIVKGIKDGIVTSTTVMMNMQSVKEDIEDAKANGIDKMGVHLTLTKGKPVSPIEKIPSLAGEDGGFKHIDEIITAGTLEEIELELRAQIEEFVKTGLKLTHLDSHHHVHGKERICEVCISLAREYGVPLRKMLKSTSCTESYLHTDYFTTEFYGASAKVETIKKIISEAPEGTTEIMCHPGYVDEELKRKSSYAKEREIELDVLTDPQLKRWIEREGIELISYDEVNK